MLMSWILFSVGTVVGLVLGLSFQIEPFEVFRAILTSNLVGFSCLLMITFGHQSKWFKKYIIPGPAMTWILFSLQYFVLMYLVNPILQDWKTLAVFALPLIATTGPAILVFGPFRDWLIRREQRKQ